jgi:hypothetical protein
MAVEETAVVLNEGEVMLVDPNDRSGFYFLRETLVVHD